MPTGSVGHNFCRSEQFLRRARRALPWGNIFGPAGVAALPERSALQTGIAVL